MDGISAKQVRHLVVYIIYYNFFFLHLLAPVPLLPVNRHQSAITLKPVISEVNNINYLVTMELV